MSILLLPLLVIFKGCFTYKKLNVCYYLKSNCIFLNIKMKIQLRHSSTHIIVALGLLRQEDYACKADWAIL